MKKGIAHAHIERFPSAGHFPMLEEPQNFCGAVKIIPGSRTSRILPLPGRPHPYLPPLL